MADKRLSKINVNTPGWQITLEGILDDILEKYNLINDDTLWDYIINSGHSDTLQHAMKDFNEYVLEIYKYYPWLLQSENYELLKKGEEIISKHIQITAMQIRFYFDFEKDVTVADIKYELKKLKDELHESMLQVFSEQF